LIAVSLLLLVPCAAAATYAMRFDVETNSQDPAMQDKERQEKEKVEMKRREGRLEEMSADPRVREEMERKERIEVEMREVRQAALIRLAKINMDQAIQIATGQQPGKVLECTLDGEHWKEPGKLADDGFVFYRVIIANENSEGWTMIWVNATDGSIMKSERELPRKREP